MRNARYFVRLVAAFWTGCVCLAAPLSVVAQLPPALEEQIEQFNSLPRAQQEALLRQIESSLPAGQRDEIVERLNQQSGRPAPIEPTTPTADRAAPPVLPEPSDRIFPVGLKAGDTIVIEFELRESEDEPIPADERRRLEEMRTRLAEGNPYVLDSSGRLYLPGVPAIQLAGLDPQRATVRIRTEPSLTPFDVTLTHLPLEPVGVDALEPFGYDLFSGLPARFATSTAVPVPEDYIIGPGDTVNVQLFGNENQEYVLPVSREGTINFPQIGPITVSGLTLTDLRATINERVNEQLIGVRASTTLGNLRSIQVFVVGDVRRPGSYTVSGFATITSALYASGGVLPIGSLRNVSLVRDGEVVSTLDLYDLLLRGDTSNDVRVRAGDAILVPPIGATVSVDGEVQRPAIYEIRDESTVSDLIQLAGGFKPTANRSTIKLERIVPGRGIEVHDIDLSAAGGDVTVRDGDVIRVQPNLEQLQSSVRLEGNVYRPGLYQWYDGMTIADLLPAPEFVKPLSDLNYVLIRREEQPNVRLQALSVDLQAIWDGSPDAVDLELQPRDTVTVFNLEIGRRHVIQPLLEAMTAQAPSSGAMRRVSVNGQVRAPGEYPLEPGMRVSDLIRAGGGLTPSAYSIEAELTRYEVVNGEYRETELITVDLAAVLRGESAANVQLAPYDHLTIKEVPRWNEQQSVRISGEVQFPGEYTIRQGETLSSVLERAGGLTDLAFPDGSVFTRVDLREREREQLETLARRVESDLAAVALSDPGASEVIATGQTLVNQLRRTEAVGRMAIDLGAVLRGARESDIVLRDGDQLFIPPITQEVMVLGEVQYPTSHLYRRRLDRDDYIQLSGGVTNRADRDRIYIVRANGSVVPAARGGWFVRSSSNEIRPGDTIVVPLDTDRVRPLVAWEGITQVLYNIAIAVSVIDGL